jgi:hypothetical protein
MVCAPGTPDPICSQYTMLASGATFLYRNVDPEKVRITQGKSDETYFIPCFTNDASLSANELGIHLTPLSRPDPGHKHAVEVWGQMLAMYPWIKKEITSIDFCPNFDPAKCPFDPALCGPGSKANRIMVGPGGDCQVPIMELGTGAFYQRKHWTSSIGLLSDEWNSMARKDEERKKERLYLFRQAAPDLWTGEFFSRTPSLLIAAFGFRRPAAGAVLAAGRWLDIGIARLRHYSAQVRARVVFGRGAGAMVATVSPAGAALAAVCGRTGCWRVALDASFALLPLVFGSGLGARTCFLIISGAVGLSLCPAITHQCQHKQGRRRRVMSMDHVSSLSFAYREPTGAGIPGARLNNDRAHHFPLFIAKTLSRVLRRNLCRKWNFFWRSLSPVVVVCTVMSKLPMMRRTDHAARN